MMKQLKVLIKVLIKVTLEPLIKNYNYTFKYGSFRFKRKGDFGFVSDFLKRGKEEEQFLSSLNLQGKTIYDVGSYVGCKTMFFAKAVGEAGLVIAFEPNPENIVMLRENLILNRMDNVVVMEKALGDKRGTDTMAARFYESATSTMDIKERQNILNEWGSKSFTVEVYPLDVIIEKNHLPKPDFVKIDAEGKDYEVLCGMRNTISHYKPSLFIEMQAVGEEGKLKNAEKIVEFLNFYGYNVQHVESKKMICNENVEIAKIGHIYATMKGEMPSKTS